MASTVMAYIETSFPKIRQLRSSSKGEVWLASDASGKLVVVKHILITGLPYKALKERPQPITPNIIYCTEQDGKTIVVEEYVQGDSLLERLEEKRYLTEQEAESILLQLCDGLKPLHEQGIIHRDIKPSNLILQHGGMIRLIDFDAARTVKEDSSEDTRLLGTRGYAPPEQFGYGQTDERSDIYAIGITMRKMLGTDYDGYLNGILTKCTELDPKKRYVSVTDLKRAILWKRRKKARMLSLLGIAVITIIILMNLPYTQSPRTTKSQEITQEPSATNEIVPPSPPIQAADLPTNSQIEAKEPTTIVNPTPEQPVPEVSQNVTPFIEIPSAPVPEPIIERTMETRLTLNGVELNTMQPGEITLNRKEWSNYRVDLQVKNNSNTTWENPGIRLVFRDNWGGSHTETKSLPPVAVGATADFSIPVGSYDVTDRPEISEVSAWLQIYLENGTIPIDETYWCVQFLLRSDEPIVQEDTIAH